MGKRDDPRSSKFEALLEVAAMFYEQDYGTREEDKSKTIEKEREIEARIFGDKVPRKKRSHRSHRSSSSSSRTKMTTPWTTRLIEQQRSGLLQNPNTESEPSSSSCVTQYSSKKRRHFNLEEEESQGRRSFKKRKVVRRLDLGPSTQTSSPPEWLVNNGRDPKLITEKQLYKSDLDRLKSRLSVSANQVANQDFLTEEETRIIDENAMKIRKDGVSVELVDPLLKKHVVDLRKWKMSGNWYYVFVDGWNDVVAANRFKVGDVFHLWSFRSGKGKLCFALVPLPVTNSSHVVGSTLGESSHGNTFPDHGASTSGECSHGCSSLTDAPSV